MKDNCDELISKATGINSPRMQVRKSVDCRSDTAPVDSQENQVLQGCAPVDYHQDTEFVNYK